MANNMGKPQPAAIAAEPELQAGNALYLYAFYDLDSERPTGMGVGRIPWHAIEWYAEANEFDYEQRYTLFIAVRRMDGAYITHFAKKDRKAASNGG
jgi:hypothetical protein